MGTASSQLLKTAVHQERLMSREGLLQRLFSHWFNGWVYNQIWEDPRVDLQALELTDDSQILTIASGGCNILNYLIEKPKRVVAVDLNPYHMYFTRLKLAALEHLPNHESFYQFFGYANKKDNLELYQRYISAHLDEETRHFWEKSWWPKPARIHYFSKDVYRYARFGYFIRFLHQIAKMAGSHPERLLQAKTPKELEEIFHQQSEPFFNSWVVKTIGHLPFSVFSLGIPPQQYNAMREQSNGNMLKLYRDRIHHLAGNFPIQENYFAWQAFARHYDHEKRQAIPDYLRQEHYETLKANLHRVETHITSLIDFLEAQPRYSLDRFVFLDAQDWMKDAVLTRLWQAVAQVGRPGSRIIFRTASDKSPIETALPSELRARFVYEKERSFKLYQQDRSAIYGGFHLYHMPEG
jgi:S-adenosylmethionine-diacylglycerol 3-amino-3-carboxypropyl transferase